MCRYRYGWLLVAGMTMLSGACRKFVVVQPPDTLLSTEGIFSGDRTALSALMGMYSRAMLTQGLFLNGGNTVYPMLSGDDATTTQTTPAVIEFSINAIQPNNTYVTNLYGSAFNAIYNANTILENLDRSPAITTAIGRLLKGEALFMRAFVYSRLVDLFGPVPLETTTNADINAVTPRSASADVYRQIMTDLHTADTLLETVYVTAGTNPQDRTRPNRWTVRALLARIYLSQRQWANADEAASALIDNSLYRLEPSVDTVFKAYSREAIWQLQPVSPVMNTAEGNYFLPSDNPQSKPLYTLTNYLLGAFEAGDKRRARWVGQKQVAGVNYYYPTKYRVRTGPPYTEYNTVIRLAEMYLVRAEARAQLGALRDAVTDLNGIRVRAGIVPLPDTLTQEAILTAVMQERRVELFAEWGHRWADLKRTGLADTVLGAEKTGWHHDAALYPIPLTEVQRNPVIVQNAGY